ncbi:MAG TPA: peptidylprolyl isomerase [Planctomycetota bacterium]
MDEAALPAAELAKYWVLLTTNRGDLLAEFWPDVAPNHVRNFLDLSHTGFYDGTTFHRVIPGFMIQGGDPDGSGSGNGPRILKAEFNAKKHVPGVLSAARTPDPNSASCQFFVMHANAPHLDGQYSGFGQLVTGLDVVDRIVKTPRGQGDRPHEPQIIERAVVVKAPADPAAWKAQQ